MIRTIIQAGFGNQLFQYATGYALAKELNQDLCVDISFFDDYNRKSRENARIYNLDKLCLDSHEIVNRPQWYWLNRVRMQISFLRHTILNKKMVPFICEEVADCREYQPQLFEKIDSRGASIMGFWQNTAYFDKYINDLQRQFRPNYELDIETSLLLERIKNVKSVGVHIRRGDFVGLGWDCGSDYYSRGMDLLRRELHTPHFFIVSDDVKWATEMFGNEKDVTIVSVETKTKDIDEFFLLSSCKHQVISESTFGWWAAYLNSNIGKKIIVPRNAKGQIFNNDWIRI